MRLPRQHLDGHASRRLVRHRHDSNTKQRQARPAATTHKHNKQTRQQQLTNKLHKQSRQQSNKAGTTWGEQASMPAVTYHRAKATSDRDRRCASDTDAPSTNSCPLNLKDTFCGWSLTKARIMVSCSRRSWCRHRRQAAEARQQGRAVANAATSLSRVRRGSIR